MKKSPLKRGHRIRNRSLKRAAQERLYYGTTRPAFLAANKACHCCCCRPATDIHHKKGRTGKLLNDTRFFVALCRKCHSRIEQDNEFAYTNRFKINRASTTDNHE